MPTSTTPPVAKSGIKTTSDGTSIIPSSKRPDGSTRKEIRVRPGYKPPEDVETYKNRSAESWKNRDTGGVPGADPVATNDAENRSKNAKRRDAARRKAQENGVGTSDEDPRLATAMKDHTLNDEERLKENWRNPSKLVENPQSVIDEEAEKQKKIRNLLKKLKAIRELKEKKASGDKLSHDQIMKMAKEPELVRDLQKLEYRGPELDDAVGKSTVGMKADDNGAGPD